MNIKTAQAPLRSMTEPQGPRPASYVVESGAAKRQVWYELASGLSGLALALFMWGHMVLVGSILTGARGFDWLAGSLEEYYIAQPTVAVVLALFIIHAVMAARKVPAQLKERKMIADLGRDLKAFGQGYPGNARGDERFQPHLESLLWIWQIRTGMIILVLGSFHVLLVGFDVLGAGLYGLHDGVGIEAVRSLARVQGGLWMLYAVLLLCVEFHASIGMYRLAIKWGVGSRLGRPTLHRIEKVLLWFFLGLGIVVLAVLAGVLAPPLEFLLLGGVIMESFYTSDVLVIGGGLAGERAAIEAAASGLKATILSLVPPRRSHSCAAQGGMQASLGNCVKAAGDNANWHFLDTVRGSDWGADQEVARMFAEEARVAVREMAYWGVPWTRLTPGKNSYFIKGERVEIDEPQEKAGMIMHRDFGGTAKWRACYASAGTGHSVLYAVDSEVSRLGIEVRDRMEALSLIYEGDRCWGVVARCLRTGKLTAFLARATVIATGGYGRIYGKYTTNATINEGTGAMLALNTGSVPLGNMEAIQFHPTGLWPSGILITEGCRGDGGYLVDKDNIRFVAELEPEKQELASRDVVSRHMMQRVKDGKGAPSKFGPHIWLDLRHLGETHLKTKLREIWEICRDFAGIDPVKEMIPVRPFQHYSMGGVRVNKDGHAYNMRGLFAAGEAACWDMHGFNRLGGNSLAETVVAGRIVGQRVAQFVDSETLDVSTALTESFVKEQEARIADWMGRKNGSASVYDIRDALGETMINKVGIFRTATELEEAVEEIRGYLQQIRTVALRNSAAGVNPELTFALRLEGMLKLALIAAKGALARNESRGAHCRVDFPQRDDKNWLKRTLARWPLGASEPELSYEPVGLLDLPPGERGYGHATRIPLDQDIEDYNKAVDTAQKAAGRNDSVEPQGSQIQWGAWQQADGKAASS